MSETLARRWLRRYKLFFILGLLILAVQIFLAYKSLRIPVPGGGNEAGDSSSVLSAQNSHNSKDRQKFIDNSVGDDEDINSNTNIQSKSKDLSSSGAKPALLNNENLGFTPTCEIHTKEAISAILRAKTEVCRKHIANITCLIQSDNFYSQSLPSSCPHNTYVANRFLGCYKDEKEYRLLAGYYTNFKLTNSPRKCIQMCLQSGFPYAGVQYSTECFCGNQEPSTASKLPDPSCNMKCPGNAKEACGGYFTINIYETGIAKFTAQIAETVPKQEVTRVRIAFLLTLNGRAVRQVHRLIKSLYSPDHVFYIHVDSRENYMYRELQKLESRFPNIRLARNRYSTIWGGASLLTMLLQCMKELLASDWQWDFVINLSESDFPVKSVDKLVNFLTANKGRNFVKSHGRETQRFIQKQGLDKTFIECDTHMWRTGDRELPNGIQIDGGSDWIALYREFVQYVTKPEGNELLEGLMTIFRHTLLPAESFFHTVLRNSHFCGTYTDNNLHVTNWKRRLGCKCQYKHVVDWCGCSPNDFKPDDWSRIQSTEQKLLFFARKFEPMINQAVILQLEEWLFGPYPSDFRNLNAYWQSIYHHEDKTPDPGDGILTIINSLMRITGKGLKFKPQKLYEITNYKQNDEYKGFIIRYSAILDNVGRASVELETRIRPSQSWQTARNLNFAKRIKNFEISSDYDQKEQVCRNFGKFLHAYSEPVLTFRFLGSDRAENHSYNLTVLWIDPTGSIQDFNEIHVEDGQTDAINFSKANVKHPMTAGVWIAKLIGKSNLLAQTKFLITPLIFDGGRAITQKRSEFLHLGSRQEVTFPEKWQQYLPNTDNAKLLQDQVAYNSKRIGENLIRWIDSLVLNFYFIRETCSVNQNGSGLDMNAKLDLCHDTSWSTLSPDPKSDVYALLNRK